MNKTAEMQRAVEVILMNTTTDKVLPHRDARKRLNGYKVQQLDHKEMLFRTVL